MADQMLFIGWGQSVRGAEERGLEVFNDAVGLMGRMQQDGRIEGFDVNLLAPNGALNGFMRIHGTAEQIVALRQDEEFRRNTIEASLIVDGLRHIEGYTNEGVAAQMGRYQQAVSATPQRA